jgi:hypothetical protein
VIDIPLPTAADFDVGVGPNLQAFALIGLEKGQQVAEPLFVLVTVTDKDQVASWLHHGK